MPKEKKNISSLQIDSYIFMQLVCVPIWQKKGSILRLLLLNMTKNRGCVLKWF